ncbi:hypothetical protein [Streptomyces sp. CBMA152]|uniref:hypothetical protein n=1 Tax=Streptomyces sp. CBMA152 TaxID=1896312 RepID=UPI0016601BCE|nr:hypothetical protein [Streptomyces sp. CBMA152]MBD0746019.1 hypothetical protein [Streptomyces sp. CBMA152]
MNSLKGFGVCVVLAGIAYAITRVADTDQLVLGITISVIVVSLVTYAASIRRRRRDHRLAGE